LSPLETPILLKRIQNMAVKEKPWIREIVYVGLGKTIVEKDQTN
jgi:hypothetical protein